MQYIQSQGSIGFEADYPYKAVNGTCNPTPGVATVSQINQVIPYNSSQLKAAIALQPVSVTLNAGATVFHNYTGGIVTSVECGTELDHAVAAVGYGNDFGIEYYLVRNSWGADWGKGGYIKIGVDVEGVGICGIQQESVFPTAVSVE